MNKNRKFLIPLAALASVFVSHNASATVNNTTEMLPNNTAASNDNLQSDNVIVGNGNGDLFKFILKRTDEGQLMAYHSSHSSHSSHASHSSHQSGR